MQFLEALYFHAQVCLHPLPIAGPSGAADHSLDPEPQLMEELAEYRRQSSAYISLGRSGAGTM
jgi:hypothetical protein